MKYQLVIRDLSCPVRLGILEEERKSPQEVRITFKVKFLEEPKASFTDRIEDTTCYDQTSKAIGRVCQSKEFATLEHLGHSVYAEMKKNIPHNPVWLEVQKVRPPIDNLMGGVSFCLGEEF